MGSSYGFNPKVNETVRTFYNEVTRLNVLMDQLRQKDILDENDIKKLGLARKKVEDYNKQIKQMLAQMQLADNQEDTGEYVDANTDYYSRLTTLANELEQGKATIKGYNSETNTLTYTIKTGKNEITEYTLSVRDLDRGITKTTVSVKKTEGLFDAIKRKTKEIGTYLAGSFSITRVFTEIRRGIQYVKEIDSALTELKKVTDETEETYDRFLNTASKTASKVGSTIKDVVSSTADWARLGYSLQDAAQLAESTQILMNVSEFTDISRATDSLISSIQAFKYTAKESMDVVDILNTIGKQYCRCT